MTVNHGETSANSSSEIISKSSKLSLSDSGDILLRRITDEDSSSSQGFTVGTSTGEVTSEKNDAYIIYDTNGLILIYGYFVPTKL
jgi:hypothetical protein